MIDVNLKRKAFGIVIQVLNYLLKEWIQFYNFVFRQDSQDLQDFIVFGSLSGRKCVYEIRLAAEESSYLAHFGEQLKCISKFCYRLKSEL